MPHLKILELLVTINEQAQIFENWTFSKDPVWRDLYFVCSLN